LETSEKEKQSGEKFLNKEKIKSILIPTCIIHGEHDEIISVQEGLQLYEKSGAANKDILIISDAGHNDLMMIGHDQYFEKIEGFIEKNFS
jgi:alpha-beta hydrolase superfamily lysophospholipase